jgi:multidrug efflux pump subunit AcrA (membrane-fusion protein)
MMNTVRIALCLLSAAALAGCGKKAAAPAAAQPPERTLAVRALPAASRPFERRLTVQGTLESKHYANVAARVAGNLDQIWVDEGDAVKAGETRLFQIDPVGRENALTIAREALAVTQASLAVSQANAEKARAEARKAALDFARYTRLHEQNKVTDNEFETRETLNAQAKAGVKVAEAQVLLAERQVRQAEAAAAIARKNFDDSLVLAPISGVVSERRAEPGEQMDVGHVVLRLDDLTVVEAAAFLPAQYYADVVPGKTRFRLEVNGRDAGTHDVLYRSPTVHTTLRTFEIKGLADAAGGLAVPGSLAALTLVFETREGLGIPSSAILIRGGKSIVFVIRDGRAAAVEVAAGLQNDAWTEIRSGLAAGDKVVTEGQTQLRDKMPVEIL